MSLTTAQHREIADYVLDIYKDIRAVIGDHPDLPRLLEMLAYRMFLSGRASQPTDITTPTEKGIEMHQDELIQTVANLTSLPRPVIRDALMTAAEVVAEILADGEEDVSLPGFGKFKSRLSAQRIIRLPLSREERLVGGKRVSKFCASGKFAKRVRGEL